MSISDSFVQIAPDSTGKRMETAFIDTPLVDSTGAVIDVYRQRAEIVGTVADSLDQLLQLNRTQVQLLQAILSNLNATSNVNAQPEDFPLDT
jgi:hypothetical protein